jgi:GNAT superfamily N-acetyltransferase
VSELHVVGFTPERMDAVRALWSDLHSEEEIEKRSRIFEWFAIGNPFLEGSPPYYLLLDGERVIGMHGESAWRYSVAGKRVRGTMSFDDLLSPDCRGRGLGKVMLGGAAEHNPVLRAALWHNEPNLRLYAKAGWIRFDDFFPYVRVFDPTALLRGRLGRTAARLVGRPVSWLLRVRELLRRRRPAPGLRLREIECFDDSFDEFFTRVADRFDVIAVRDSAYLNWKFVDKPFGHFTLLAAHDADDRLVGYLVFRCSGEGSDAMGTVVDVLADPDTGAFAALIQSSVNAMRERAVAQVSIACSDASSASTLQQLGFLRARQPLGFMVHGWEGRVDPSWVKSARHWYLTFSDADGAVWDTDDGAA